MSNGVDTLFAKVEIQEVDLDAWHQAWRAWLSRKSENTRRAYTKAWADLGGFTGRDPWEISSSEVENWVVDLQERKLKPTTVALRLAAVRSFYGFVCRYMVGSQPLHTKNPAQGVEAPQVEKYTEAVYLDGDQVRAFFRVIPRDTPRGLRDYALFLFYISTGRRSAEIRKLRWGDLKLDPDYLFRWHNKGKTRWDQIPWDVWLAIRSYLVAVDRLEKMRPADYVFTAITGSGSRFPHLEDYDPTSKPLSSPETVRILRKYARKAGIQVAGLRVHSLRHTAAMLWRAVGLDTKEIQAQLGHSNSKTTDLYLHTLEGQSNAGWAQVKDYLGL